jgi:hypothetical protein
LLFFVNTSVVLVLFLLQNSDFKSTIGNANRLLILRIGHGSLEPKDALIIFEAPRIWRVLQLGLHFCDIRVWTSFTRATLILCIMLIDWIDDISYIILYEELAILVVILEYQ